MSALDGLLFIDEAYTLDAGSTQDFGAEAIGQLIADMENYRDRLVVIMAGYSKEMRHMMQMNQGLTSRFTNWIEFDDYSLNDLTKIGMFQIKNSGNEFTNPRLLFNTIKQFKQANLLDGNARFVRNLTQAIMEARDARLAKSEEYTKKDLITIEDVDVITGGQTWFNHLVAAKKVE